MPIRIDLTVASVAALADIHVSEYQDGTNAWVSAENEYFTLEVGSAATPSVNIIKPTAGSPIAGLDNARWIRNTGGGGGAGTVLFGLFAARPAATAQTVGTTYYATDTLTAYFCLQTGASTFAWYNEDTTTVGLASARPTASAAVVGNLYFATDTSFLFVCGQTSSGVYQWFLLWPSFTSGTASQLTALTPTVDLLGQFGVATDTGGVYLFQTTGSGYQLLVPPSNAAVFSANASLTNAAAQFVPIAGAATSLSNIAGSMVSAARSLVQLDVAFTGDVANVAGQTATVKIQQSTDHGATYADVTGATTTALATTAGAKFASIAFTAVAVAEGAILRAVVTPSAGLTAVLTLIAVSVR